VFSKSKTSRRAELNILRRCLEPFRTMLSLLYVIVSIAAVSASAIPPARDLGQRTYIPPSNITILLNEYTNYFVGSSSSLGSSW
jgi:glycerol uptake facilitator-like aquaporin